MTKELSGQPTVFPDKRDFQGKAAAPIPFASKVALIAFAIAGLAWLNYAIGGIVLVSLGGTAQDGYIDDGLFFLGSHGRYTEVSADTFWVCFWYWRISLIAFAASIAAAALSYVWARRVVERRGGAIDPRAE
jgi:hypothetical protein